MLSFVLLFILFQLGRWALFWVNYHVFLTCLIYLSIHPFFHPSIHPSVHPSIHPSVCLYFIAFWYYVTLQAHLVFPLFQPENRPHPPQPLYVLSRSVMSDSLWPRGLQPARLLCPWGFSRQEYWSGLPCPPPGDLPNPGIEPRSPALQVDSLPIEPPGKPLIIARKMQIKARISYCPSSFQVAPEVQLFFLKTPMNTRELNLALLMSSSWIYPNGSW